MAFTIVRVSQSFSANTSLIASGDLATKALPFGAWYWHLKFKGYHNGIGNIIAKAVSGWVNCGATSSRNRGVDSRHSVVLHTSLV